MFAANTKFLSKKSRTLVFDEDHHVCIEDDGHENVDDDEVHQDQEEQIEQWRHDRRTCNLFVTLTRNEQKLNA